MCAMVRPESPVRAVRTPERIFRTPLVFDTTHKGLHYAASVGELNDVRSQIRTRRALFSDGSNTASHFCDRQPCVADATTGGEVSICEDVAASSPANASVAPQAVVTRSRSALSESSRKVMLDSPKGVQQRQMEARQAHLASVYSSDRYSSHYRSITQWSPSISVHSEQSQSSQSSQGYTSGVTSDQRSRIRPRVTQQSGPTITQLLNAMPDNDVGASTSTCTSTSTDNAMEDNDAGKCCGEAAGEEDVAASRLSPSTQPTAAERQHVHSAKTAEAAVDDASSPLDPLDCQFEIRWHDTEKAATVWKERAMRQAALRPLRVKQGDEGTSEVVAEVDQGQEDHPTKHLCIYDATARTRDIIKIIEREEAFDAELLPEWGNQGSTNETHEEDAVKKRACSCGIM